MINRQLCRTVRKPNEWNKYEKPISNLIYAILMQAISDANGYIDGAKKYHDGEEAVIFLETEGEEIMEYLRVQNKAPVRIKAQEGRIHRFKKRGY